MLIVRGVCDGAAADAAPGVISPAASVIGGHEVHHAGPLLHLASSSAMDAIVSQTTAGARR
jgi:hypothetical protein